MLNENIYMLKLLGLRSKNFWAYVFSSATPDKLSLSANFTGKIRVKLAATSEIGIHPAILSGRQNGFEASVDVLKSPKWNQYEATVADIAYIVNGNFDGLISLIGFDDDIFKLNAGDNDELDAGLSVIENEISDHWVGSVKRTKWASKDSMLWYVDDDNLLVEGDQVV